MERSATLDARNIRNIAIIAHVDHGKTTLVDAMLRQCNIWRANQVVAERIMDSMDQERERGITIVSKNASVTYVPADAGSDPVKINLVDTPGHADFGGEVERVMSMVDGVLLLVDAVEGPMPQTRYVLHKALDAGHRAIVVVNKIDRADARPDETVNLTFDLFAQLEADDQQLDFPVVYANALAGKASLDASEPGRDLRPLFETIVSHIAPPHADPHGHLAMLVSSLDYDSYRGRMAIGKIVSGRLDSGEAIVLVGRDGSHRPGKIADVFLFEGLNRTEVESASAGEIVAVSGLPDAGIGDTLTDIENPTSLPMPALDEPTLRMTFGVNTSPLAGREGPHCTSRKLRERLARELETNVSLRVEDTDSPEVLLVSGRGELHLAVLIETMRREGYELQVSQPEVICKEIDGRQWEPVEEVTVDVADDYLGAVIEQLGQRRGEMIDMQAPGSGAVRLRYRVPTRGLIGFRSALMTLTRGTGVVHALFAGYQPLAGDISLERNGSLVATECGVTTTFGLRNAEARGSLFIGPGVEVYEGMIVGKHQRDTDLDVNVCKARHASNIRANTAEIMTRLSPPTIMSLDRAIEYIGSDELVEVTPANVRMRKRILSASDRRRAEKRAAA